MRQFGCWPLLAFAVGANLIASAQTPPALSADLPRYYFKTPADEVAARADLTFFVNAFATEDEAAVELADFDVPITCADTQVRPGDIILGDRDGVLVIPASQLDAVLYQAVDVEAVERDLAAAVDSQAPLEAIAAILKRKKALRV